MKANDYIKYVTALEGRTLLSKEERNFLITYHNGEEGEKYFTAILNSLNNISYIHSFEFGSTNHVQIDFLVATSNKFVVFEVKHYKDEWYFEHDTLKNNYGIITKSPIIQVRNIKHELQKLLHRCGIFLDIESYIVFTNPHLIPLGTWPKNQNIILPHELDKISKILSPQLPNDNHQILNLLLENESKHSTYYLKDITTKYDLKYAGIKCPNCRKMHTIKILDNKTLYCCSYCKSEIKCEDIVFFNLKELYIIKRDSFTFEEAIAWCYPVKKYTIERVCKKYFLSLTRRNRKFFLDSK
ncbi:MULTISPECIES: nuclease-related domain-containing protein [unclassified Mammaliicoccus]|uniref:nuclease-related domain-containing protein n=1 Tax=unclassified Mammaliicoccus TaxID=2803851 RepID=UPI001EFA66B2|nr:MULTISPECIES: nuclease-related domain-containing protein [unclassified Mammaliicoccus]